MEVESIRFGQFTLHPGQRRLISEGEAVPIGGRALDLLILLTSGVGFAERRGSAFHFEASS